MKAKLFIFCSIVLISCNSIQSEIISTMKIESPVFQNNQTIPEKYTCKGANINPPLSFVEVPENTKTFVLIVDDPDAPMGDWVHWILWNIPSETKTIPENSTVGVAGSTDFGENKYGGPCPPAGTHRYFFKLYALDSELELPPGSNKADLLSAMEGHILAYAELVGLFSK